MTPLSVNFSMSEHTATKLIMAALAANIDRPEGRDPLKNEQTEEWLDGYVEGFEQAALCLGKALGHESVAVGLIGSRHGK